MHDNEFVSHRCGGYGIDLERAIGRLGDGLKECADAVQSNVVSLQVKAIQQRDIWMVFAHDVTFAVWRRIMIVYSLVQYGTSDCNMRTWRRAIRLD